MYGENNGGGAAMPGMMGGSTPQPQAPMPNGGGMGGDIMARFRSLLPQDMAELDRLIDSNVTLAPLIIRMFPEIEQEIMQLVNSGPNQGEQPGGAVPGAQPAPGGQPMPVPGGGGLRDARV